GGGGGWGGWVGGGRQGGLLPGAEARRVEREAKRPPAAAARVLARARALREALSRIFGGLAEGAAPAPADLALLDRELHEALDHLHLIPTRGGHALAWPPDVVPLARPLWTAARSAADLLTEGNVARLKTCPSASCR